MSKLKSCTKEEFDAFIKNYPKPLRNHTTNICEPPYTAIFDGKKVVASVIMAWMNKDGEIDKDNTNKFWAYKIRPKSIHQCYDCQTFFTSKKALKRHEIICEWVALRLKAIKDMKEKNDKQN